MEKPLKVFWNGRHLRDIYPHATWFQVVKYKLRKFFRKLSIVGGVSVVIYLAFLFGAAKPPIIQEVAAEEKFADYPLLVKICKAESQNTQFRKDGRVMRGSVNPSDIGFCQIHEPIWNDKARELGYDIFTEEGNKNMAIYIFLHEGSTPWNTSRCSEIKKTNCWRP